MQTADRKQDSFRLLPTRAPIIFEASGKRLFLLVGLQLRQQERMADADLLAIEGFDHDGCKLNQLKTSRDVGQILASPRGDLLDALLRLLQIEKRMEALRLLHRMNVASHKIFDQLCF